jgi:hypothetical protein
MYANSKTVRAALAMSTDEGARNGDEDGFS